MAIRERVARAFEGGGEMRADAALDPHPRDRLFPTGRLTGRANVDPLRQPRRRRRRAHPAEVGGRRPGGRANPEGDRRPAHIDPAATVRGLLEVALLAGAPVSGDG